MPNDVVTWINRDGCYDDEFYKATMQILDLCRAKGISLVGVVCDRHQDMSQEDPSKIQVTALCTLEDKRMAEPLTEAASEHVAEQIRDHINTKEL